MERAVTVACVQAEPVILDRERTLDKLERLAAEAAGKGAELVVFPETFVPVYPSSRWAKAFAGWENAGAKETFARIAQNSIAIGSPAGRRRVAVDARAHRAREPRVRRLPVPLPARVGISGRFRAARRARRRRAARS